MDNITLEKKHVAGGKFGFVTRIFHPERPHESLNNLTPELKASMDELREAAESMKRSYSAHDPEKASDEANTILNPVVKGSEAQRQDVTPATAEHQASAPAHAPDPVADEQSASPADLQAEKTSATAAVPHSSPASSDKP